MSRFKSLGCGCYSAIVGSLFVNGQFGSLDCRCPSKGGLGYILQRTTTFEFRICKRATDMLLVGCLIIAKGSAFDPNSRWNLYAPYVKKLRIRSNHFPTGLTQVLNFAKVFTSHAGLLPNLRSLDVYGKWLDKSQGISTIATLFAPTLHWLRLEFRDSVTIEHFCNVMQAICLKLLNLEFLQLYSSHLKRVEGHLARKKLDSVLSDFLRLRRLRTLGIPSGILTDSLMFVAGELPELHQLFNQSEHLYEKYLAFEPSPIISCSPCERGVGSFPTLTSMDIEITSNELEIYLESFPDVIKNLQSLAITYNHDCTVELSMQLARIAPRLDALFLQPAHYSDPSPDIYAEIVAPFASCRSLRLLEVLGFVSSSDQLREILHANRWSSFQELALIGIETHKLMQLYEGEDNGILFRNISEDTAMEGLTVEVLNDLACLLPELKILEITVVASPVTTTLAAPMKKFQCLECLTFISSFINFRCPGFDCLETANYISKLLNKGVEVTTDEGKMLEHMIDDEGQHDWFADEYYACMWDFRAALHL